MLLDYIGSKTIIVMQFYHFNLLTHWFSHLQSFLANHITLFFPGFYFWIRGSLIFPLRIWTIAGTIIALPITTRTLTWWPILLFKLGGMSASLLTLFGVIGKGLRLLISFLGFSQSWGWGISYWSLSFFPLVDAILGGIVPKRKTIRHRKK